MEARRKSGKCKWRKPCAIALAAVLTGVSMGSWSAVVLAAGGFGNEEDRVPISEVHSSADWLPVGDVEEIPVEALSQEEAREAGLLENQQIQRLPNSRSRAVSLVTVPGGTTYGYDWIRDAANTGSDAAKLQGLYEAYAKSVEEAYASSKDYQPNAETGRYYGSSVDVSSLGLPYDDAGVRLCSLAFETFLLDNPQYYVIQGYSYTYYPDRIESVRIWLYSSYASADVRSALQTTMESKYEEYAALAATGSSIYDKVRLVHDKMLAERDYSFVNGIPDESDAAHNIVGVLDTSTVGPVCESFAEAFAYILNRLGIDCLTVTGLAGEGDSRGGHAWNLVQMEDGKYYYVDSTWDNRDDTQDDTKNLLNDIDYTYFLVGNGNTDFGAGSMHAAGDINRANEHYVYGLPSNISSTDYLPNNPSAYLTDSGYYGTFTKTAADNYDYVIGKGSTLVGESVGSKEGNPLIVKVEDNGEIFYFWNGGPYTYDRKSAVSLYRWDYDSGQEYMNDIFSNATALIKGVDYNITKTEPIDDTISRVWLQGAGSFKGIDFVLVKKAAVISSVGLMGFTPPALGAVPQGVGDLTTLDSSKYQVTSLTWTPSTERYNASKVYQATVELKAKAGYFFDANTEVLVGASQAGDLSGVTMSTPVVGALSEDEEQNTLTFELVFPKTAAPVVREHGTVGTGSTVQGSIDLKELFPADKGTPVGYEILSRDASGGDVSGGDVSGGDVSGGDVSEGDFSEDIAEPLGAIVLGSDSIDENGVYHYTTTVTDTPAETKVVIKVMMSNYQDTTLTLLVRLVSKQVPMGQPLTTAIVYGQSLSESVLTGTMKNSEGETIEGSFAWKAPDTLPSREQNGYAWIFTPADTNLYLPAEGIAAVEVKKAATYQIAISAGEAVSGTYQFPAAEVGYGAQTGLLITVKNTGNSPTDVLDLALSDTQGFTLSTQRLDSLAAGETGSFLITPVQGLSAGTYTAQVTVKGEGKGIQGSLQISFTVNSKTGGSEEGDEGSEGDEPELQLTQETVDLFQGLSEYVQSEVTDKDGNPVSVEEVFGGKSVEIRFAEDQTGDSQVAYLLGISADNVFPFSISLYVKGTNDRIQPGEGYAVKIRLPLPEQLVDQREVLQVARVVDGQAQILPHTIRQINGQYVIEFLTDHFSTYAFVLGATNSGTGDSGSNNNGSGSENGNSSKSESGSNGESSSKIANSASGTEPDQVGTSPKTGDMGSGLQPQPIKDGKALLTITSESQEKSALSDILQLTIIAVAAGIAIAGIVCGMVLLTMNLPSKPFL